MLFLNSRWTVLLCAVLFAATGIREVPAQKADTRVALVIGNAAYPDAEAPLKHPVNNARAVAEELRRYGFEVDIGENLTKAAMRSAFDRFYGKIKSDSTALLFFSGYGIQSARQSYMIPVNAQVWTEADVRSDGFGLDAALTAINAKGARVKIAILDASRRNPFERRFRSVATGLAPVAAPRGTVVMYAAAPNTVVTDGERELFVSELLKEIRSAGKIEEAFNRTLTRVSRTSQFEQVPWFSSSLVEEFSFVPSTRPPAAQQAAVTPAKPATPARPKSGSQTASAAVLASPAPAAPSTTMARLDTAAVRDLDRAIQRDPNDTRALYRRGLLFADNGDFHRAINDFDEAIRINPKDVEALNNRCWARAIVGDLQLALRDCNEALHIRPRYLDALDSRGFVKLKIGQNYHAIADYDAALQINPKHAPALYGRGIARLRSGSRDAGNRDIASAKAIQVDIDQEFAGYGIR